MSSEIEEIISLGPKWWKAEIAPQGSPVKLRAEVVRELKEKALRLTGFSLIGFEVSGSGIPENAVFVGGRLIFGPRYGKGFDEVVKYWRGLEMLRVLSDENKGCGFVVYYPLDYEGGNGEDTKTVGVFEHRQVRKYRGGYDVHEQTLGYPRILNKAQLDCLTNRAKEKISVLWDSGVLSIDGHPLKTDELFNLINQTSKHWQFQYPLPSFRKGSE